VLVDMVPSKRPAHTAEFYSPRVSTKTNFPSVLVSYIFIGRTFP